MENIDIENMTYEDKVKLYKEAKDSYYNKSVSIISDFAFDMLEKSIADYEEKNNLPRTTLKIGSSVIEKNSFIRNRIMTSIGNSYNMEDLEKWIVKSCNYTNKIDLPICVSPKFDGVSLNIVKLNNEYVYSTRGDGVKGTIVNSSFLTEITNKLVKKVEKLLGDNFDIRGEIYITKDNFEALNNELETKNEKKYSNQRNAASGILLSKSDRVKYLSFVIWDVISDKVNSMYELYKYLYGGDKDYAEIFEHMHLLHGFNIDTVSDVVDFMESNRYNVAYPTDGLVFIFDNTFDRKTVNETVNKYPLYVTALKYPEKPVKSTIIEVDLDISRTGTFSPVAVINPIIIDGVKVSRITLHNYDYIKTHNLMLNDEVEVIRSGGVIPKIISNKHTLESRAIVKPIVCPSCKSVLSVTDKEIKCYNTNSCRDIIAHRLVYFFSKQCFDVKGLGIELAKELVDRTDEIKYRSYWDKFYDVLKYTFSLDKHFKDTDGKNIRNFFNNIKKRKLEPSESYRILAGLGLEGMGVKKSMQYNNIMINVLELSKECLKNGIGKVNFEDQLSELDQNFLKKIGEVIDVCKFYSSLHKEEA